MVLHIVEPMRALVKLLPAGPDHTERPDPSPGPNDAVIRVKSDASLCGTDAHIYNWDAWAHSRIHPPESSATNVRRGRRSWSDVSLVTVGDYVAAESPLTCGACFPMPYRDKRMSARITASSASIWMDRLPTISSYRRPSSGKHRRTFPGTGLFAGTVGQCGRCGAWSRTSPDTVLITGCGPTGLFAAAVARTAGAATIIATDVSDYRLGLAETGRVDHVLNAKNRRTGFAAAILDITRGEGVDASLEMSGHPPRCTMPFVP